MTDDETSYMRDFSIDRHAWSYFLHAFFKSLVHAKAMYMLLSDPEDGKTDVLQTPLAFYFFLYLWSQL